MFAEILNDLKKLNIKMRAMKFETYESKLLEGSKLFIWRVSKDEYITRLDHPVFETPVETFKSRKEVWDHMNRVFKCTKTKPDWKKLNEHPEKPVGKHRKPRYQKTSGVTQ